MYRNDALLTLGFKTDESPDKSTIEKAYKSAALKYHPDKLILPENASDEEKQKLKEAQAENFLDVSAARECLLNPDNPEHASSGGRNLSKMSLDEYMRWTYGANYTSQFSQVYGDKSQEYNIGFDCYTRTKDLRIAPESLKTDYFYFDSTQELKQFCLFLENKNSFEIDLSFTGLPLEADRLIVDAFEKNNNIMAAEMLDDFLSPEQTKRLEDILHERNYPNRLKESQKKVLEDAKNNSSMLGLMLGVLFTYYSFGIGFLCAVGGYFLGSALGALRYKYLDYAADKYYTKEDVLEINDPVEKEALKAGVDATNWQGYFSSYTNYAANRHPLSLFFEVRELQRCIVDGYYAMCRLNNFLLEMKGR